MRALRERRKHARLFESGPAQVGASGSHHPGTYRDISATGVALMLPLPLDPSEQVNLSLTLSDGYQLRCRGTVRRRVREGERYLHGVQFSNLSPNRSVELQERLQRLLGESARRQQGRTYAELPPRTFASQNAVAKRAA